MTSRLNTEHKSSETNGYATDEKKQKVSAELNLTKKVFTTRNSVLTDLMEINHLRSVYNISVAVCALLFISAVLYYLADPEKFWQDIYAIGWGSSKFSPFLIIWISFHLFAYANYEAFKLWVSCRNKIYTKIVDKVFLVLFISSFISMYIVTPYAVLSVKFPPITGFAIMCEQVRISMKIYSFVRENVPRAKQYKPDKDGKQELMLYPSRKFFFYFLFAPTLIYRDSYPRTPKIDWNNAFCNLYKFVSVIFITYCLFMRFNHDLFKSVGLEPFTRREAALILAAGSTAVGAIMMFLMFYGVLHAWHNLSAEICRFADREFYQDWWNSTSFSQYYRKMNTIVYDWLYAYIYAETQKVGFSKSFSMVLVFIISALVHEYIICFAIGFFYPALCLTYSTIGIFVLFLTKQRTGQFWNIYMWGMLFTGWGMLVSLYSTEWFARINCPKEETSLDFFIPRSWDQSCQIFDFSKI